MIAINIISRLLLAYRLSKRCVKLVCKGRGRRKPDMAMSPLLGLWASSSQLSCKSSVTMIMIMRMRTRMRMMVAGVHWALTLKQTRHSVHSLVCSSSQICEVQACVSPEHTLIFRYKEFIWKIISGTWWGRGMRPGKTEVRSRCCCRQLGSRSTTLTMGHWMS